MGFITFRNQPWHSVYRMSKSLCGLSLQRTQPKAQHHGQEEAWPRSLSLGGTVSSPRLCDEEHCPMESWHRAPLELVLGEPAGAPS